MTKEFRRLTFSFDEVPEILNNCVNKNPNKLPEGSVSEVGATTVEGEFHYSIKFFNASDGKEACIDIAEKDVHQALIDFCKKQKIPIPRDSLKTVRVVNKDLCLDVLIGKPGTLSATEEFMASINHQLRTPLNAIIGMSEIIKGSVFGPLENSHYRDYIDDIYISGKNILGLIANEFESVHTSDQKDNSKQVPKS